MQYDPVGVGPKNRHALNICVEAGAPPATPERGRGAVLHPIGGHRLSPSRDAERPWHTSPVGHKPRLALRRRQRCLVPRRAHPSGRALVRSLDHP
eukprot:2533797-Prymnesium_polylepis.1